MQIRIDDYSEDVKRAVAEALKKGLEMVGLQGEKHAKALCPVDTGNLRNSITHTTDEDSAYIGTNVEYAPYVEYGDYRHTTGKNHFLRDAAANHGDHYKAIMEAVLKS